MKAHSATSQDDVRPGFSNAAWRKDAGWLVLLTALWAGGCSPDGDQPPQSQAVDPAADGRTPARLLLTQGTVFTMVPGASPAQALAVGDDGRILAVGSNEDITARYQGETRSLGGAMVLPGFHDAHSHPIAGGVQSLQCDLSDAATVAETLAGIETCHQQMPDTEDPNDDWLVGGGWNLGLFPEGNPHKRLIDDIVGERPVFLEGADGHSGWANSAALQRAGVTADTQDPPLGVIERDASGEPTGTLRETAQALVGDHVPPITDAQREAGALAALKLANGFGITSIVAASVDGPALATWRTLEQDGRLTARIVASIRMAGGGAPADSTLLAPGSRGSGDLVRADAAKIFLDGVLEGETAALLSPYLDPQGKGAGRLGTLNVPWEALRELVTDLDARGIQVHMHAIGDRAVREGLDAVEAAREANGPRDNRHHICHLQLVHPDDYGRFGELGVLANFQALWAFPDAYITDINLPAVGAARVERMYPIGSIEDAGGTVVGGSDWSVSSMNPLDAIEVAVTRQDPNGGSDAEADGTGATTDGPAAAANGPAAAANGPAAAANGVLNAGEAVSLETMLAAYTRNAAYLMHQEADTGTLEAGKLADLVVLNANLFEIEPSAINDTRVLATYLAGRLVYEQAQ